MNTQTQSIPQEYKGVKVVGRKFYLFDNHVEIELDNGMTKTLSLTDFHSALSDSLNVENETKGIILPSNCYYFAFGMTELKFSCYYPGKVREISYIPSRDSASARKFIIPFPNIIVSHILKRNGEDAEWQNARYFATSKPISQVPLKFLYEQNPLDQIWNLPMTNIYEDAKLCHGNNTMPRKFKDNFRGLDWHFAVLYNSPFNDDLGVQNLVEKCTPFNWYTKLATFKEYPYELLKYGKKVTESKSVTADIVGSGVEAHVSTQSA